MGTFPTNFTRHPRQLAPSASSQRRQRSRSQRTTSRTSNSGPAVRRLRAPRKCWKKVKCQNACRAMSARNEFVMVVQGFWNYHADVDAWNVFKQANSSHQPINFTRTRHPDLLGNLLGFGLPLHILWDTSPKSLAQLPHIDALRRNLEPTGRKRTI